MVSVCVSCMGNCDVCQSSASHLESTFGGLVPGLVTLPRPSWANHVDMGENGVTPTLDDACRRPRWEDRRCGDDTQKGLLAHSDTHGIASTSFLTVSRDSRTSHAARTLRTVEPGPENLTL